MSLSLFSHSLLLLVFLSFSHSTILLQPNTTLHSPNNTFTLGFITPNPHLSNTYLAIYYSSLPSPTYTWIANRQSPLSNPNSSTLSLSHPNANAHLILSDSLKTIVLFSSPAPSPAGSHLSLLDTGNLLLRSLNGTVLWQSFDYPTDTWLPGMNITALRSLTSWRSPWDPSPGRYSMRVRPQEYGEIELLYNNTVSYWTTGNWTGNSFVNVPEMTVPYIYRFYFDDPFTPSASFGFSVSDPTLTRFQLTFSGELEQHTWSQQTEHWNTFWARPDARCQAYGLCGPNGLCYETCGCPPGFGPADGPGWATDDFSAGCRRIGGGGCGCGGERDEFVEMGLFSFEEATMELFPGVGSRVECEKGCLVNCSCVGVIYDEKSNLCKGLFGSLVNLRNLSNESVMSDELLYLRIGKNDLGKKNEWKQRIVLICAIVGSVVVMLAMCLSLWVLRATLKKRMEEEEEVALAATHLRVFSYKELHGATRGFSEKLGHGGFGTVFRGMLPDSSHIAIKCLERPGSSGEKEFRAEVCTIGNVQHVNLVRLRGFCSENSHRLLVYDYMPNGPLSGYLKKDGLNMSWDVRFRVAMGTARALAYLHEECRDCIIHCDIKPENILLDWDYSPKVSDFGLAKLIGRDFSRVLATMRGTWGYVAPEWISGVAITTKADVYSYGMTMLELIGGRRNVEAPPTSQSNGIGSGGGGSDVGGGDKWFFPPWAARQIIEGSVADVVDPRLGVAYDKAEAERLAMVAVWCIQDEEIARPSMGMVVKMLEGVVDVGVPPPPKLLQALVSGDSFPGVGTGGDSGSEVLSGGGTAATRCLDRLSVDSLSSHSPAKW